MNPVEIKKGIYWVGAIDWSLRSFHGYKTKEGSTYNAYLIVDEKIVLIDTVKADMSEELLERVSKIVDPAKIDYLISNHVEMDHSGAIPEVMKVAKNAKVVTSSPQGLNGLKSHYGDKYDYMTVKSGDTLNIGSKTLSFVQTPMLHWPDNMVTYCEEDKVLFSNDAFGQHYASASRFDDETAPLSAIMTEAKLYYANILMPFGAQIKKAYEVVSSLDIDVIAPSHGIMWRSHINEILESYETWGWNKTKNNAVVVFDSMWESTEKIAHTIVEAFIDKGVNAKYYDLKYSENSDIISDVLTAEYVVVGSPTLNNNMLPEVASFLTYLKGLAPRGVSNSKKAFAFGSYGWGGQSIKQVEDELKLCNFDIVMPMVRVQYVPSSEDLEKITKDVYSIID